MVLRPARTTQPPHRAEDGRSRLAIDALVEVLESCCDPGIADEVLGRGFGARVGQVRDRLRLVELAAAEAPLDADSPVAAEIQALRRQARRLEDELLARVGEIADQLDEAWEDTEGDLDEADARWLLRHLPHGLCDEARALKAELSAAVEALEHRLEDAGPR